MEEKQEGNDSKLQDSIGSESEGEGEPKNEETEPKEHRHFGNFKGYYKRRYKNVPEDPRLGLLKKEWFEGKDILDIGCNSGEFTLTIAQLFLCRSILAIDIDHDLIKKAKMNLNKVVRKAKTILKKSNEDKNAAAEESSSQSQQLSVAATNNDNIIPIREQISFSEKCKLHDILQFRQENFITSEIQREGSFDTILCLSITQWIHLNWGDQGILTLFAKIWQSLRPGGLLVLEPQPWNCYLNKKDFSITTALNYCAIEFYPEGFQELLLDRIGFRTAEHINPSWVDSNDIRGFNRPVLVFKK